MIGASRLAEWVSSLNSLEEVTLLEALRHQSWPLYNSAHKHLRGGLPCHECSGRGFKKQFLVNKACRACNGTGNVQESTK